MTEIGIIESQDKIKANSPWCDYDYSPSPGERSLLAWLKQAAELPGKATFRMAILVLQAAIDCRRKQHLMINPQKTWSARMSRVAAYEGLRALEEARLVTVKRCRGRSPLVTVVEVNNSGKKEL